MGINIADENGGKKDPNNHKSLFYDDVKFLTEYYVNSGNGDTTKECGSTSKPCKSIKVITEFVASEHTGYSSASVVNIILLADTSIEDAIEINPSKYVGKLTTIKSNN
jgi:hypothetical protein